MCIGVYVKVMNLMWIDILKILLLHYSHGGIQKLDWVSLPLSSSENVKQFHQSSLKSACERIRSENRLYMKHKVCITHVIPSLTFRSFAQGTDSSRHLRDILIRQRSQ